VSNKVTLFANRTERNFFEDDASARPGLQPQTDVFNGDPASAVVRTDSPKCVTNS